MDMRGVLLTGLLLAVLVEPRGYAELGEEELNLFGGRFRGI